MKTRRKRVYCNGCMNTIFVLPYEAEDAQSRCALCSCYIDGMVTPTEAIDATIKERNLSRKQAEQVCSQWVSVESGLKQLPYPNGYIDRITNL